MSGLVGFDVQALERIDEIVRSAVEHGEAPGVVAGVARGETVHVVTAGVATVGGPPMRQDTLFRISSTTKPITAAVVLSLVDQGLLNLNDPIDGLLPELANRRVLQRPDGPLDETVAAERQLSTFGPPQPGSMPDPDTWMARLGELPLLAQPGDRWLYQSGSQVLGVLVARAAGAPFASVLRQRIFGPLGVMDTPFDTADPSRLASAYERLGDQLVVTDPPDGQWSRPPRFQDGSGGLLSTVDDWLTFGRMLMRGGSPVLTSPTVAEMTRNQLTAGQRSNVWPGFSFLEERGWGYGVSVLDDGRYTWEGGLGTAWSNVPSRGLTVVVLTQRAADESGMPPVCNAVLAAADRL